MNVAVRWTGVGTGAILFLSVKKKRLLKILQRVEHHFPKTVWGFFPYFAETYGLPSVRRSRQSTIPSPSGLNLISHVQYWISNDGVLWLSQTFLWGRVRPDGTETSIRTGHRATAVNSLCAALVQKFACLCLDMDCDWAWHTPSPQ